MLRQSQKARDKDYPITIRTASVRETIAVGRRLGSLLSPGDVICLTGELGSGKTCFVKGVAEGLGIKGKTITSPTFIIVNEYRGRIPLYHIDLYRIGIIEDLRDIGMEEMVYGQGVTAIEWAERITDKLPDERIEIKLDWVDEKTRTIELKARDLHHTEVLERLREKK